MFLDNEKTLKIAIHVFKIVTLCSVLKVNRENSEAIWIGACSNFRHKQFGLKWTKGVIYLRVYITNAKTLTHSGKTFLTGGHKTWKCGNVDTSEILFGIPNERDEPIVNQLNVVILYGKYHVYRCKKDKVHIHLHTHAFLLECHKQILLKLDIKLGVSC